VSVERVRIWDLPTRVFHWAFATLILLSWISGQFGGSDWREWHFRSGYAVLALLAFRMLWGFAGSRYARFSSFVPSLKAALVYWRLPHRYAGLSPPGALSVYSMLAAAALQVLTGLMASDDNYSEGPWAKFVSDQIVSLMSAVHAINRWALAALICLHIGAIAWFALVRREVLVRPMLTGDKLALDAPAAVDDTPTRWRGALLFALATALTVFLVKL
jgi:cytochrome b